MPDVNACPSQRCEKENFTVLVIHISMNTYTYGKGITASYDVE
jgi:hypothetical protein